MTLLQTMRRGFEASVTLDNINLSNAQGSLSNGAGAGSIPLVGNKSANYEQIYRSQIWVWAAVNRLAFGVARLPLKVYIDGDQPGERERLRTGRLPDLIEAPYEGGDSFLLTSEILANLAIHGNAIAVKVRPRPGMPPTELIPSSWAFWRVQPGKNRRVDWYVFNSASGPIPYLPSEVVHFRRYAPGAGIVSPSPLEPLARTLMVEDAAQRTQIASYENGVRPTGAVSVEGQLKPETAQRMRAEIDSTYGGVDNAFKILLMEAGAKWQDMSHTLIDSKIVNARKLTREEVAAAFNMPPPSIGILDRATFSNIEEQHIMEYSDTDGPWLRAMEKAFKAQLIRPEPVLRGQYVEFDLNEVLRGNTTARYNALFKSVGGPFISIDEARATENLPPLGTPESKTVARPLNMEPIGVKADGGG